MNDRARTRVDTAGAIVATVCCATPHIAAHLPLVRKPWLIAWGPRRRRAKAARCETGIHKGGVKP